MLARKVSLTSGRRYCKLLMCTEVWVPLDDVNQGQMSDSSPQKYCFLLQVVGNSEG